MYFFAILRRSFPRRFFPSTQKGKKFKKRNCKHPVNCQAMSDQEKPNRSNNARCSVGVSFDENSNAYSFPQGHPLSKERTEFFASSLLKFGQTSENSGLSFVKPCKGSESDLLLFHDKEYVEFVKSSSKLGTGFLDYGDTPSFKGVFEASLFPVGNSLQGLRTIMEGDSQGEEQQRCHFFNPIGGLHHARRDRAGGFCVFNDAAIAIEKALKDYDLKRIAYVDIDAHHGDGVYYGFESDPRVIIGDIHEDGRFLYPGTGSSFETGESEAKGTKLNIPLPPSSQDKEFISAFDDLEAFIRKHNPEIIFFQCGADGLDGDPITHLRYSSKAHAYATRKLHLLAHEICKGRILAMGGGGYNPQNVASAWISVIEGLSILPQEILH